MRIARVAIAALVVVAAFAAGLKVGAHWGVGEFLLEEGAVKGTLLAGELKALRAGDTQKIISAKEIELDGEIVKAMAFRDGGHPWLLWPFNAGYEHTRYLRSIAAYRAEHPSVLLQLEISESNPMKGEMDTFGRELKERTNELLRDYGK